MIVQCPDCASRFRLAEEKLKPGGTRIRCTKCRNIFTVTAPPQPQSQPEPELEPQLQPRPAGDGEADAGPASPARGGTAFNEFDLEDSGDEAEAESEFSDESDFDFGAFDDIPPAGADAFFSAPEGEEDFSFGDPLSFQDEVDFSMDGDDEKDSDDFSPLSEAPRDSAPPAEGDSEAFEFSSTSQVDADADAGARRSPVTFDPVPESSGDALFGSDRANGREAGLPPLPAGRSGRRKSRRKGVALLVLLLLAGAGAGGYFAWREGLVDLSRVPALLKRVTGSETATGQIRTTGLNGFYLPAANAGRLFVIQGEAVNEYRESRSAITVKGVLFDAEEKILLQQTVYCGNPLDGDQLATMPFERIVEQMNNQFGDSLSNLNVPAGKSIPFTIVFRNLPEGLSEFSVEVVDSKPVSR